MLQAAEYESSDKLYHFLVYLLTSFVDFMKTILSHEWLQNVWTLLILLPGDSLNLGQNEAKFKKNERPTVRIDKTALQSLESYQAAVLNTQKWHPLHHNVDAIKRVGGSDLFHSELYESTHKHFKKNL